jgi:hypothetical protein
MDEKDKTVPRPGEAPSGQVRIMDARREKGALRLRIAMTGEFYDRLLNFLKEKGYTACRQEQEGIAMLIEYGLSKNRKGDLEKISKKMMASDYPSMRYECYKYFKRNQAITIGLRSHLEKNRALKKKLKRNGVKSNISKDKWDKWDGRFINSLYRKYVFGKKQ